MQSLTIITVLLALGASAMPSRPVQKSSPKGAFSIPVHRKQLPYMTAPAQLIAQTKAKYSKFINGPQKREVTASQGTVPADPTRFDREYLAPVWVGGQSLSLDFDTGSSDLWAFSTLLPAAQKGNHSLYDPSKSSKAQLVPNSSWAITYNDGSTASGVVYTDCVYVGGTVVEGQGVEAANTTSGSFQQDSTDGVLGLAFDSINNAVPVQQTFMGNAISQGLPQPVFTANLFPKTSGSYDFGYIDQSKYSGDIAYADVDTTYGYWMIDTTGYSYGYGSNQTKSPSNFVQSAVVDTGTSINFLNLNVVRGYWSTVPKSSYSRTEGGYIYPCGTTLPDFTIQINNFSSTIPGKLIEYSPTASNASMCFGAIQNLEYLEYNILGDTFLKTVFAVFDMGDSPRVGFAKKA